MATSQQPSQIDWVNYNLYNEAGFIKCFSSRVSRADEYPSFPLKDGVYWLVTADNIEIVIEKLRVNGSAIEREEVERLAQGFEIESDAFLALSGRQDVPFAVLEVVRLIPVA